jgi:5-methylcytosine-specific restriction protein B
MILDEKLREDLQQRHKKLYDEEELLPYDKLKQYYATFRERFGPERLMNLDGEALLETMHNHSNAGSLAYWLEFKNDDEFPARFGSIAGGSALKFGCPGRKPDPSDKDAHWGRRCR